MSCMQEAVGRPLPVKVINQQDYRSSMRTRADYFERNMDKFNPKQCVDHSADSLSLYLLAARSQIMDDKIKASATFHHDNLLTVTPGIILRLYAATSTAPVLCSHLSKVLHHTWPSQPIIYHLSIVCLTLKQYPSWFSSKHFRVRLSNTNGGSD